MKIDVPDENSELFNLSMKGHRWGITIGVCVVAVAVIGSLYVWQRWEQEDSEVDEQTFVEQTRQSTLIKGTQDSKAKVYYDGSIIVSGKYQEYRPLTLLGGELCFYPDDETGYLIPRDLIDIDGQKDSRMPWFCFRNQAEAKENFDILDDEIFDDKTIECIEGKATVRVSQYVVNLFPGAAFDTAYLDEVISKEGYSTLCE